MQARVHLLVLVLSLRQQPPSALECTTAQSQSSYVFINHVIQLVNAISFPDCTQKCEADSQCHSINWYPYRGLCELNNATHLSSPEDFVPTTQGTYLIYFLHPTGVCNNIWCKESEACLMNSDGLSYRCKECSKPLGMQHGRIPNVQIKASSFYGPGFEPWQGRLHSSHGAANASAWSAEKNAIGEYLQVDLGSTVTITKVATQGKHGSSQWVTNYSLKFSLDGITWTWYKYGNQIETFKGNTDRNTIVTNRLLWKIDARYIRIVALAWKTHISMRAELYGCTYV